MHRLIEQRRGDIAELCRRYGVRRLEIFGSGARAVDFDPQRSDVDFLVQFDTRDGAPGLREFFDLRDELTTLLGRPVDLVMAGSVSNPFVKADVERTRQTVYAA